MTDQTPQPGTALPWVVHNGYDICDAKNVLAECRVGPSATADLANAAYIVTAANAYPTHLAEIAALRAERDAAREALRQCRRATLHGADEPRRTVREIVDEALTTGGQ